MNSIFLDITVQLICTNIPRHLQCMVSVDKEYDQSLTNLRPPWKVYFLEVSPHISFKVGFENLVAHQERISSFITFAMCDYEWNSKIPFAPVKVKEFILSDRDIWKPKTFFIFLAPDQCVPLKNTLWGYKTVYLTNSEIANIFKRSSYLSKLLSGNF